MSVPKTRRRTNRSKKEFIQEIVEPEVQSEKIELQEIIEPEPVVELNKVELQEVNWDDLNDRQRDEIIQKKRAENVRPFAG